MIEIEEAVRIAIRELPRFLGGRALTNVRVEEVVPPDLHPVWHVTLSFLEPSDAPKPLIRDLLRSEVQERVLRVMVIDAATGDVKKMIRRDPS
jgi:hypothetical protein